MSIICSLKNSIAGALRRQDSVSAGSSLVAHAQRILNLPDRACEKTAERLAQATVVLLSYASPWAPRYITNRYHAHCAALAERCYEPMDQALNQAAAQMQELAQQMLQSPRAIDLKERVIRWIQITTTQCMTLLASWIPYFSDFCKWLETPAKALVNQGERVAQEFFKRQMPEPTASVCAWGTSQLKSQLKTRCKDQVLLPLIQTLHRKSVEQVGTKALSLSYYFAIKYWSLSYLSQTMGSLLQTHQYSSDLVWTAEKGLQAYIWGPTAYQCSAAAWRAYQRRDRVQQIEDLLQTSGIHIATQLGLSAQSGKILAKGMALALSELPFLTADLIKDNAQEITQAMNRCLESFVPQKALPQSQNTTDSPQSENG